MPAAAAVYTGYKYIHKYTCRAELHYNTLWVVLTHSRVGVILFQEGCNGEVTDHDKWGGAHEHRVG